MYCKYCGKELKGTENFCNKCGNKLNDDEIGTDLQTTIPKIFIPKESINTDIQKDSIALEIEQNVEGVLTYIFGFITGIFFLLIERNNKFVKFHADQEIGNIRIFYPFYLKYSQSICIRRTY